MRDLRERLCALRNGLLRLHKALLESERAGYERDIARITSTGQYLGLVLNDPWFHWLHAPLPHMAPILGSRLDDRDTRRKYRCQNQRRVSFAQTYSATFHVFLFVQIIVRIAYHARVTHTSQKS